MRSSFLAGYVLFVCRKICVPFYIHNACYFGKIMYFISPFIRESDKIFNDIIIGALLKIQHHIWSASIYYAGIGTNEGNNNNEKRKKYSKRAAWSWYVKAFCYACYVANSCYRLIISNRLCFFLWFCFCHSIRFNAKHSFIFF